MSGWARFLGHFDFCAIYFTTQLLRCAAFSYVLIALVMLLRKMLCTKRTFLRGMLWSLFFVIPFLGRLRLFYENEAVFKATWWLISVPASHIWVDRIYMAGIFLSAICICTKRLRLQRTVAKMEKTVFDTVKICVTDVNVTPFTVGLLKPKIVLPRAMMDHYSREEIGAVVRHEQTHIRLGHLWCGFAWDFLRCLIWVNPFLTLSQRCFWADLEDICDRVCIQNGGCTAQEYGLLLLKSVKLLRTGQDALPPAVTYAGEKDFADMKRRICTIADFEPYRKGRCACMAAAAFFVVAFTLALVHSKSYARCTESSDIFVYQYDGEHTVLSNDTEALSRMISYDDCYVYVDREAFEAFLRQKHAAGDIYIVFGGYYKLPGLGGAADGCIYEGDSRERIVRIPYESIQKNWEVIFYKYL